MQRVVANGDAIDATDAERHLDAVAEMDEQLLLVVAHGDVADAVARDGKVEVGRAVVGVYVQTLLSPACSGSSHGDGEQ